MQIPGHVRSQEEGLVSERPHVLSCHEASHVVRRFVGALTRLLSYRAFGPLNENNRRTVRRNSDQGTRKTREETCSYLKPKALMV